MDGNVHIAFVCAEMQLSGEANILASCTFAHLHHACVVVLPALSSGLYMRLNTCVVQHRHNEHMVQTGSIGICVRQATYCVCDQACSTMGNLIKVYTL